MYVLQLSWYPNVKSVSVYVVSDVILHSRWIPGEVFGIDGTAILTAIYEDELVEEPERRVIIISNIEIQ